MAKIISLGRRILAQKNYLCWYKEKVSYLMANNTLQKFGKAKFWNDNYGHATIKYEVQGDDEPIDV